MSGGISSGGLRSADGGQSTPTAPVNGGTGRLGLERAAGITKPEADIWYVNTDEAGDEMLGPLVVEGRLVDLDPAAGNALVWTQDGLYAPPAEALPEELLTEAEGAALFAPLAHTTAPDQHPEYATDADLAELGGDASVALAAHAADADAHGDFAAADHTHPSEESGPWRFQDTVGGTPGSGYLRTNTGALASASTLIISRTTQDGYDIPPPGWGVQADDTIYIQDRDDSTKWVRYRALEPLVRFPTYATGLVEVTGSAGGAIVNGQIIQVSFSLAGGGGGGAGAVTSVNGETGAVVLDAADVGALTQTAGDARYEPLDSAYTKSEADARYLQLADQGHNHTGAEASGVLTNDEHDGYSQYTNLGADPTTPVTNRIRLYSKDNGSGIATLYYRTEDGTIYELPTLTGGGSGSGAPANGRYVTTAAESKLSQEVVLGTGVIMSGVVASRPAAGTAGRLYLGTDTDLVYRDTGGTWETFATRAAGGGAVTSVNGETGVVVLDAADVGALALSGGTVTGSTTFNTRLTVAGGAQPKVTVASSAPGSPATGDLWVW